MTSERGMRGTGTGARRTRGLRRPPWSILGASAAAILALGCADFSRGGAAPDAGDAAAEAASAGGDAKLSFATDIFPILSAACPRCHVAGGPAGDTQLLFTQNVATDLAALMPFIDTSAPASSRMLTKMSGQGHGGGTVIAVATTEYETVLRWIEEGALP